MKIHEYLEESRIIIPLKSIDKFDAIRELISVFQGFDTAKIEEGVIEREKKMTTGIGWEVAIPHTYMDISDKLLIAVGVSMKGIDFQSIDSQPVRLIFLNITPESNKEIHKKYLQHLSLLLSKEDNRQILINSFSADDFIETLELIENSG